MIDLLTPAYQRQQRIGSAQVLFSAYLEGALGLEWCARHLGISSAQFREGAQTWVDGGRKDSVLDAFLSRFSLLTSSSPAGASTPSE